VKYFLFLAASMCLASSAFAQSANPFMYELKQFYTVRKGDLLKTADRMPAENYDFKPTPDVRSFGQLIAHIADAQMGFCSGAKGKPIRLNAASKTTKADLLAALKASFDECDDVFDTTTDALATQMIKTGDSEHSKFWSLRHAS